MAVAVRVLVWLAVVSLAGIAGCNCDNGGPKLIEDAGMDGEPPCDCPEGETCAPDGTCESICNDGRTACIGGSQIACCGAAFVCFEGTCSRDCGAGFECNGLCCEAGEQCFEDRCAVACADTGQLCGADLELCCPDGDVCINQQCVTPGTGCMTSDDCALDEICDPSLEQCIDRDLINECIFMPPIGEFTPSLGCRWTPPITGNNQIDTMTDVVMTPAVANLTDDNGDGLTNTEDFPDIVFISFDYDADGCCTANGVVRVVSGACNPDQTMNTHATLLGPSDHFIGNSSGVALGNLHPASMGSESAPEIVATYQTKTDSGVVAWRRTADDGSAWAVMWTNTTALDEAQHSREGAQPSLADVNGDGQPEVVIGNVVLDGLTGGLVWDGKVTVGASAGVGNNAFLGPSSTIADIDLDGVMEVVAGNTVYSGPDGTGEWTATFDDPAPSICQGNLPCDGYNGVGNFDADDEGEVVIIRQGQLYVLNHDGSPVAGLTVPIEVPMLTVPTAFATLNPTMTPYVPTGQEHDDTGTPIPPEFRLCTEGGRLTGVFDSMGTPITHEGEGLISGINTGLDKNEAGPPTIADFDGDGHAEIGTAGSTAYVVFDLQCTATPVVGDSQLGECESEWIRWTVENNDCSSRATASSVFDFEGDGKAEVVYADETNLRVFSGVDGSILYDLDHSSNTRVEMPVVVDVDNDGKSEMVIPEPNTARVSGEGGIEVYVDTENNWVRTRRIWNQHAYHVTNITEDGQVPADEPENWRDEKLNNFRQNVQPNGLFDAPDFVVRSITRGDCPGNAIEVRIEVGNDGALSVPPGLPVYVTVDTPGGETLPVAPNPPAVTDALRTTEWLLPGQSETLEIAYVPPSGVARTNLVFNVIIDADGSGGSEYNECDETNNSLSSNPLSCVVVE